MAKQAQMTKGAPGAQVVGEQATGQENAQAGSAGPAAAGEQAAAPAAPAGEPASEPKKERRAEHEWLNATGDVVEDIELATGLRYSDKATSEQWTWQIPGAVAGSVQTMVAAFGAKTRAINAASAARQARKADPKITVTDVQNISAVFAEMKDGQWAAPAAGGSKAPKYDLDALAAAIAEHLLSVGKTPNLLKIREKLGDSVAYRNGALQTPGVLTLYTAKTGKAATADELDIQ